MNSSLLKLEHLSINNFATIKNQEIAFEDGFNVIVGETGSGKSLILDALHLTFGARADKRFVRKGSEFATVEVILSIKEKGLKEIRNYFDDLGFPLEESILIKRIIYKEGSSKTYLNHQSCPLNTLKNITRKFIDLVGQFENQKLLSPDYQLKLLDSYSKATVSFNSYRKSYEQLSKLEVQINALESKFQNREREIDYLDFQLSEFKEVNPSAKEEERLISLKNTLLNSKSIEKTYQEIHYSLFEEEEGGMISKIDLIKKNISNSKLEGIESVFEKLELISDCFHEIDSIISGKVKSLDSEDESLDEIVDLLDKYQKLKRKFNLSTDDLALKEKELIEELEVLNSIESKISKMNESIKACKEECLNKGYQLHVQRSEAAKTLSSKLTQTIQMLNMKGAKINFKCLELDSLNSSGLTELTLEAETNPGEGFHRLSDIASGGELSRILLSLRYLMTNQDSISIFLFDEIDTGVGGKTAVKIGEMLSRISHKSQVIAITHLPQIASFASNLITVEKQTKDSRTESKVFALSGKKKEKYISEMTQIEI